MKSLEQSGSLKGSLGAEQQLSLISGCGNLAEAVEGAMHIQVSQSQGPRFEESRDRLPASLEGSKGQDPTVEDVDILYLQGQNFVLCDRKQGRQNISCSSSSTALTMCLKVVQMSRKTGVLD